MRVRFVQGAFAPGAVGISLIKGIEFKDSKPILISDLLAAEMKKVHPLTMLHPSPCHTPHHAMLHPSPRYTPHHATPPYHYSLAISLTYPRAHRHARPHPHLDPHKGANAPDVDMSVLMGANVANEVAKLQPVC